MGGGRSGNTLFLLVDCANPSVCHVHYDAFRRLIFDETDEICCSSPFDCHNRQAIVRVDDESPRKIPEKTVVLSVPVPLSQDQFQVRLKNGCAIRTDLLCDLLDQSSWIFPVILSDDLDLGKCPEFFNLVKGD